MANIAKFIVIASVCFLAVSACASEVEPTGVTKQALSYCDTDYDCAFGPGFLGGEHCSVDHLCKTVAQDPSCGLWTGTYPNCDFYDPCRQMYCKEGTECPGTYPYLCTLTDGPGYNTCWPYAYSNPCRSDCDSDDDCESVYICESTPFGGVCG